jgi:hypothetical protein
MKPTAPITLAAIIAFTGCTATSLDRHTVNQMMTATDLRYQVVMDCLATVAANRGRIPSFSTVTDGQMQVLDTGKLDASMTFPSLGPLLTMSGTRAPQATWTLDPAADPGRMMAIYLACKWVLYDDWWPSPDEAALLVQYQVYFDLKHLRRGWVRCGTKCEASRCAHLCSERGDMCVWLLPGTTPCLSEFTLILMDIATTDPTSLPPRPIVQYTGGGQAIVRLAATASVSYTSSGACFLGTPSKPGAITSSITISSRYDDEQLGFDPRLRLADVRKGVREAGLSMWDVSGIIEPETPDLRLETPPRVFENQKYDKQQ